MVLLAENGQGKTTILNLLYGCLYGDVKKLNRIQFDSATVEFTGSAPITILKADLPADLDAPETPNLRAHKYLKKELSAREYTFVLQRTQKGIPHADIAKEFQRAFNRSVITAALRDFSDELKNSSLIYRNPSAFDEISTRFPLSSLYLPTFRRIEEDLVRLGMDKVEVGEAGINFGIRDVQQRLDEIQKEVLVSSNSWFSKINGEILSKLVNGFALDADDAQRVASLAKIDVVLDRIGNNIGSADKEEIKRKFKSKELFADKKYEPLVYFLANMVKVYEQQKTTDVAVKEFAQKCHKYLIEKDIDYNESALSVNVTNAITHEPVPLEQFSSGEKQIVSLFAKLYLGTGSRASNGRLAIFYDEPELSLSVEWQEMLLPDIINSGRCGFLFAVTHSPFILKDVKQHARDLTRFVTLEQ
jgi:ABC-type transport system involved in cytochrome c biogenesis ATPase subunit